MEDISLHILDVVENSIRARSSNVKIRLSEDRAEDLLTLEIIDDGEGMDETSRMKCLDPFYTTKRGRGGTGLGLNVVYNIVTQEYNGNIKCTSEPNMGTTFTIKFPLKEV